MKTMKLKNGTPVRVKEKEVPGLLKQGFMFCPKSEYKTLVRGAKTEKEKELVEKLVEKKKKQPKEKRS